MLLLIQETDGKGFSVIMENEVGKLVIDAYIEVFIH